MFPLTNVIATHIFISKGSGFLPEVAPSNPLAYSLLFYVYQVADFQMSWLSVPSICVSIIFVTKSCNCAAFLFVITGFPVLFSTAALASPAAAPPSFATIRFSSNVSGCFCLDISALLPQQACSAPIQV